MENLNNRLIIVLNIADFQIELDYIYMEIEVDQSDKKSIKNRVRVAIRVRPMIARELVTHDRTCVDYLSKNEIVIGGDRQYKFDRVFRETSTQDEVYEDSVRELIMGCFQGYNAAVLAYGQTGSGKTFTMGTNTTTMDCNEEGMIPKVINELFVEIEKRKSEAEFNVKASFLEIYNEQIIDLLDGHKNLKVKENGISIREEKDGSVSIYGAIEEQVNDSSQMLALLDQGSINRTTAATMMNESSSRSHAIFTIFIEQHRYNQEDQGFIMAKFFFVDLAGSERAKKTGATGTTLKEGISINLGLLELGNVISALAVEKKQAQFITYRNSKLTRILQDSLGGNSNTYMIACISPAESNYEESLNTLKYASKAMNIKNKPVINRDPHSALLNSLRLRIKELENENARLHQLLQGQGITYSESLREPKSMHEQQLKTLNGKFAVLERKNEKAQLELKQEKKKKNQLQIQVYQLQRERDMLTALLEQIRTNHPEIQFNLDEKSMPLIENYLTKIQQLQIEMLQREKINNQLQIQYSKLRESGDRDEQILIKKNETLYNLARENKQLKKGVNELKKEIYRLNNIQEFQNDEEDEDGMPIIHEVLEEEESLEADEEFNESAKEFTANEESLKTELKKVENVIEEKENILNKIANEQMELEYKLIEQMKEEYHQKISQLEREKNMLIKQQRSEINTHNIGKYAQKIDVLEQQLRDFRHKAKQQKQLQQKLSQQNQTIKTLGSDIKTFKMQKIELHRLLKHDQEMFQKYKHKRTQELMYAKKENLKKDVQIRKLTNENKKKNWCVLRKDDELKRIKKVNETLRKLMKPFKTARSSEQLMQKQQDTSNEIEQQQLDNLIERCLKNILVKIDREFDIEKYSKKCQEIDHQLDSLVRFQSNLGLKIERLQLQEDNNRYDENCQPEAQKEKVQGQMRLNLNEMTQRINNLEESRQFCSKKYEELISDEEKRFSYNAEAEIIYNPAYNSLNSMRQICKALLRALQRLLIENFNIKIVNEQFNIKTNTLQGEIEQLKENIVKINLQNQQNVTRLRQQMMMRMYENNEIEQYNEVTEGNNKLAMSNNQTNSKPNEPEKKNLERKIIELTRNNNKLSSEVEVWRRKCNIIQDKYQSMRTLFDKDKFIGRPIREEENNINYPNYGTSKQQRKYPYNTTLASANKTSSQNSTVMEELNSMAEKLKNPYRVKKSLNLIEEANADDENKEVPDFDRNLSFTKYKWECVSTIDAHTSPILAIKNYKRLLISAATRNIRLWDLETNQMTSDINGLNINSFVKSLAIAPEKELLAASCDKLITLWDLRTSNNEGVLRGHKDQIRALKIVNNYLFSAGKGLTNSGGLLVWDLRYLNFNNPMQQKQRSQDIFSMTSHNNILYYGTRDHHVRRLNIDNMETLTTFQPPHMDTVTGLAISKGYLISGSKDKNLRLWSLDNSIYNLKSTVHAFNDYITTVESDNYHPLFYSGDRTGQVKVGTILKEKIEFIGIISHAQSVNAVCPLQFTKGITATGSSDKTIKLWQPNNETFHQIDNNLC